MIPDLARLTWGLARDERVPRVTRWGLAALVVYLVSPVDVVPDWVPLAGSIDDALVSILGVRTLLRRVDPQVLAEHWPGDPTLLARMIGRDLPTRAA